VDTDLFVSDLKLKFSLPETEAYNKFHEEKSINKLSIIDEIYDTETMTNLKWQKALFADRYVFTRFACHGYHYVFCSNKKFHSEAMTKRVHTVSHPGLSKQENKLERSS
jgi:hypothetical protein